MPQIIECPGAQYTLVYWGIRGLAQPIRFMLHKASVPFSEVRLGVNQDGSLMNRVDENIDWDTHRATLDIPFPNLPYLVNHTLAEPIVITQSNVILRYLADRLGYYGESEMDRIMVEILQEEAYDFRNKIIRTAYTLGDDYQSALEGFTKDAVPRYLDGFEKYLTGRENRNCFIGSSITLVDFVIYELAWQSSNMVPGSITETSRVNLYKFIKAFKALPEISEYMQSEHYIEHPINSPWASFA